MIKRLLLATALIGLLPAQIGYAQGGPAVIFVFEDFEATATETVCETGTSYAPNTVLTCATGVADEDGWIDVAGLREKSVGIELDALASTSVTVKIYTRYRSSLTTHTEEIEIFTTGTMTAVDTDNAYVPDAVDQIRVSVQSAGDAAGDLVSVTLGRFR